MKFMESKYRGKCHCCGQAFPKGTAIAWSRATGATIEDHYWGNEAGRHEAAQERAAYQAELEFENTEIARGVARAQHIRDTANFFGEAAAAAEELAWELRDPSY